MTNIIYGHTDKPTDEYVKDRIKTYHISSINLEQYSLMILSVMIEEHIGHSLVAFVTDNCICISNDNI